jgi:3-methyladenine DNA glycosylase AlkD
LPGRSEDAGGIAALREPAPTLPFMNGRPMRSMALDEAILVRRLQLALDRASSATTKTWWSRYLKGAIEFRGVGLPQIRSVLADWRSDNGVDVRPAADQFALALRLFEEPMAEDKLAGVLYLQEYLQGEVPWRESLSRYGSLFERGLIADWNTCDWFCVRVLGPVIAANGRGCASAVAKWSTSPHLWKARASVVGFVPVIEVLDHHPIVLRACAVLIRRDERFAKTAVGWILRDLSKHDPRSVTEFLNENLVYFSTESVRNALKYSPEAIRRKFLEHMKAAQQQQAADGALRRR